MYGGKDAYIEGQSKLIYLNKPKLNCFLQLILIKHHLGKLL